LAAAWRGDRAA